MPLRYTISDDLIFVEWSGAFNVEADRQTLRSLIDDDRLRSGLSLLSDQRKLDQPADKDRVNAAMRFLDVMHSKLGPFRCAIVVARKVSFGMGRMASALNDNDEVKVRVFLELDEAKDWLKSSHN